MAGRGWVYSVLPDGMIAAIAIVNEGARATHYVRDFEPGSIDLISAFERQGKHLGTGDAGQVLAQPPARIQVTAGCGHTAFVDVGHGDGK
ncbi:MAG: hypothetical protein GKR94_20095 [Gammaproteobacteria bacterium]|nr:hypothetical protein [Gammaproteobacteria bacterium]